MKITPEQRDGVEAVGESLVVSAAAGSGKTAVLAKRFAHLVAVGGTNVKTGDRGGPTPVDRILVVTFTNAAAAEMRSRITRELNAAAEAAEEAGDGELANRLRGELDQLPRAPIGTLSSFCSTLVRRHFDRAAVDPAFAILDADQAGLVRRQVAREMIERHFDDDGSGGFGRLVDDQFDGRDDRLREAVLSAHALLTSVVDPAAWRAESLRRVEEAAAGFAGSTYGRMLAGEIEAELEGVDGLADSVEAAVANAAGEQKLAKLAAFTSQWAEHARDLLGAVSAGDLETARELVGREWPNKPSVRGEVVGKAELEAALAALRGRADKNSAAAALLRFSPAEWQVGVESTVESTALLLSLVEDFGRLYAVEKDRLRSLDFADLERHALRLLRGDDGSPSAVAVEQRRRYAHVLVDEAQDVNELQDELLRLLGRDGSSEAGAANVFVVGDVKQSIYRFRLADPRRFLGRLDAAKADGSVSREIDLQRNFRSRPPLLDAVNATFSRLMTGGDVLVDYADRHELRPDPSYTQPGDRGFAGGPVELHLIDPSDAGEEDEAGDADMQDLERIEREAVLVADRLRELIDAGRTVMLEGEHKPFSYRHAAVLMRSQKFSSERFAAALRARGVPCHGEVGTGFFRATEVRDVRNLLRVLDNRRQDVALAAVLRSPLAGLPAGADAADVLARVRLAARGADVPFFEAAAMAIEGDDAELSAMLRGVWDRLDRWRELGRRRPLAELIWHVLQESGYLAYVAGLIDGPQRQANLLELHRRAAQYDAGRRAGDLGGFLAFLDALDDAGEVGQPPAVSAGEDVVRVMSVHAAKGLEFPVVFLVDCGKRHNRRDEQGAILAERGVGLAVSAVDAERQVRYDSVQQVLARRATRRGSAAEELRILYVAMTRAREHLICVGHVEGLTKRRDGWEAEAAAAVGGRLAPAATLRQETYLDWLGLAAAGEGAEHFDVRVHAAGSLRLDGVGGAADDVPAAVRQLRPMSGDVPELPQVARRLAEPYPHAAASRRPAARSMAEAAKPRLTPPRFVRGNESAGPSEAATRLAISHLDFNDAADESAVRRQAEAMAERGLLRDAAAVDAAWLAWLASSKVGDAVRSARRTWRDLPVYTADEADNDVAGRPMLRGRLDLLAEVKAGFLLVDLQGGDPAERLAAARRLTGAPVALAAAVVGRRKLDAGPAVG